MILNRNHIINPRQHPSTICGQDVGVSYTAAKCHDCIVHDCDVTMKGQAHTPAKPTKVPRTGFSFLFGMRFYQYDKQ